MTHDQRAEAVYTHGIQVWGDEDKADALRDMVMGSLDEGTTDAYFWDLVAECTQLIEFP